jgi:hypothetical protein
MTHAGQMTTPKTFDNHHLDMSRDDGMDENGIGWFSGCHLVGFWLGEVGQNKADFSRQS